MQIQQLTLDLLSKTKQPIHQNRASILSKMVASAIANPKAIFLTNLGRNLEIKTSIKHKIKTADRLIGNQKLHAERKTIYQTLAKTLLSGIQKPIILIDWSPLSADQEQQLLRAAIAINGKRSIALYEEVHPRSLLGNREIQNLFLETLKYHILPKDITPVIIADSGFRVPFYKQVEAMEWCWIGRIRNRDLIAYDNSHKASTPIKRDNTHYFSAKDLYAKATKEPRALGKIVWTKVSQFNAQLFLYHKAPKGRIDKNLKGERIKGHPSRKQAKRESEPWLLVASNSLNITPKQAIKYYTTRMQIETGFRDTKSPYYGLGLSDNSKIKPHRYENLLLIVALAMFVLWVVGNSIKGKKNC